MTETTTTAAPVKESNMKKNEPRFMGPTPPNGIWPGAESNCRHADFQSAALPTELPGRDYAGKQLSGPGGAVGVLDDPAWRDSFSPYAASQVPQSDGARSPPDPAQARDPAGQEHRHARLQVPRERDRDAHGV